jgi:muramidase (phage lysozyme)
MARTKREKKPEQTSGSGNKKGNLIKIGALWIKHGNKGAFMSGTVSLDEENPNMTVKVLIFKNNFKEESKHPDYVVYIPSEELERSATESDGII